MRNYVWIPCSLVWSGAVRCRARSGVGGGYIRRSFGALVASQGADWPRPRELSGLSDETLRVLPDSFQVAFSLVGCNLVR